MKRLDYFDLAKGIGIFLVVLGHATFVNEHVITWVFSFHMPLFFMISGMLMAHKNEENLTMRELLHKKLKSILIPYLCFSIFYSVIDIISVFLKQITLFDLKTNLVCTGTFAGSGPLWFLTTLFLSEILFSRLLNLLGDFKAVAVSVFLSIVGIITWHFFEPVFNASRNDLSRFFLLSFPFELIRFVICMSFIAIPYILYRHFLKNITDKKAIPLFTGILLMISNIILSQFNSNIDIHNLDYGNVFLFIINAFSGSFGLILICRSLPASKIMKPVLFWGRNSLTIMATHLNFYILYLGGVVAYMINPYITRAKKYIFLFNILLVTMLVETILIILINRFIPWSVGKSRK